MGWADIGTAGVRAPRVPGPAAGRRGREGSARRSAAEARWHVSMWTFRAARPAERGALTRQTSTSLPAKPAQIDPPKRSGQRGRPGCPALPLPFTATPIRIRPTLLLRPWASCTALDAVMIRRLRAGDPRATSSTSCAIVGKPWGQRRPYPRPFQYHHGGLRHLPVRRLQRHHGGQRRPHALPVSAPPRRRFASAPPLPSAVKPPISGPSTPRPPVPALEKHPGFARMTPSRIHADHGGGHQPSAQLPQQVCPTVIGLGEATSPRGRRLQHGPAMQEIIAPPHNGSPAECPGGLTLDVRGA
ncbi:hypothetical protein SAMN05421508_106363 [Caenispirillum bisanense]|uniref:Uncharacterized protein n=1 Tax=Caenispirillum bisanense TaxID=414052 RepID=A0A286GNZ7_9PROT|nr:hypothetical protein SAMN05421508_106363 [Caenispirillum bisanense]